ADAHRDDHRRGRHPRQWRSGGEDPHQLRAASCGRADPDIRSARLENADVKKSCAGHPGPKWAAEELCCSGHSGPKCSRGLDGNESPEITAGFRAPRLDLALEIVPRPVPGGASLPPGTTIFMPSISYRQLEGSLFHDCAAISGGPMG